CYRDWSSDVCSSDLIVKQDDSAVGRFEPPEHPAELLARRHLPPIAGPQVSAEYYNISRCETVQQVRRCSEAREAEERGSRLFGRTTIERHVNGSKAAVDFRLGGVGTHAIEQRMPKAVVRDRMAFCKLAPCQFRMRRRVSADQKEGREDAFPPERVEHGGCRAGPRPGVECEHDLLF